MTFPELIEPWCTVGAELGAGLSAEANREFGSEHLLHGKKLRAIACRRDCDDVLFSIEDGSSTYAVVHLTWSGKKEADSKSPWTVLYKTAEEWRLKCMIPDHEDFTSA